MQFQLNNIRSFGSTKKQGGFTLLDAVLWFAIFGFGAMLLFGKFNVLLGSSKSSAERDVYNVVVSQVKKVYMGGGTATPGDITSTLITKGGVFSKPFTAGVSTVTNSYGGAVTVTDNGSTFTLSSSGYPTEVCTDLAQAAGDWISVTVNGSSLTLPVNLQAAVAACGVSSNTVSVTSTK